MPIEISDLIQQWGLTIGLVSLAAATFTVLMILCFREFFNWFFRINQVLSNQKELLNRISFLEQTLRIQKNSATPDEESDVKPSSKFPISIEKTRTREPKTFAIDS